MMMMMMMMIIIIIIILFYLFLFYVLKDVFWKERCRVYDKVHGVMD